MTHETATVTVDLSTDPDTDRTPEPAAQTATPGSHDDRHVDEPIRRWTSRPVDAGALVLLVGLLTATGSFFFVPSFTPRFTLLLLALPLGGWALVWLVRRRDRAALVAAAALVWTVMAGLTAPSPLLAVRGVVGNESSALIVAAVLCVWALGRRASLDVVRVAPGVVLVALGVSACAGLLQVLVAADGGTLALYDGRATGLTPNPVYFGALMVAGFSIASQHIGSWSMRRLAAVTTGFAVAANLSGSRIALITSVVMALFIAIRHRSSGRRAVVPLAAAVVGSVVAPMLLRAFDRGGAAADRFVEGGGGRTEVWRLGLDAALDRPLTGWGFGRFHSAVQHGFSADLARAYNFTDTRQVWFDAHNVVVGLVVAVGFVGAALFFLFGWSAARHARGPLASGAAAIALTWSLQPIALATLPVALLLVALAVPRRPRTEHAAAGGVRLGWVLVAAGVLTALGWVVFDVRAERAATTGDAEAMGELADLIGGDPVLADAAAQLWTFSLATPGAEHEALVWSRAAIDAEPDSPRWHYLLAYRYFGLGDVEHTRAPLDDALALQPWHAQSWVLMQAYAVASGDRELEATATDALCRLGLPQCQAVPGRP
jgi:O-antigen ligase